MLQPVWLPSGELVFISDRSGWWNLYLETSPGQAKNIFPAEAEFGSPGWIFGIQNYAALPDGRSALPCPAQLHIKIQGTWSSLIVIPCRPQSPDV